MARLSLISPAKLNLFLHVTGRREDGYHQLQTCFQLLDYGDSMRFETLDTPDLVIDSNHPDLGGRDNLAYRAAALLQRHSGTRLGASIRLEKKLPLGGGLGGGSSNAATTLLALNKLWHCGFDLPRLAEFGLSLGADVPVFVHGRSAWAEGVGETLTPLELPPAWYVVLTPPCKVSTARIFSDEQLTRNTASTKIPGFPISGSKNDCETIARRLYPEIGAALDWLAQYAPARMTGTGASVFAGFDNRESAEAILQDKPANLSGFVAPGVNTSPLHRMLRD